MQIWSLIKRGILKFECIFFSLNSVVFYCVLYGTNVHIELTCKDLPKAYLKCRTEDFALCLQGTDCLRELRYKMNESPFN